LKSIRQIAAIIVLDAKISVLITMEVMNLMKRFFALLLAALMIIGLIGCSTDSGKDATPTDKPTVKPGSDQTDTPDEGDDVEPYAVSLYFPTMMTIPDKDNIKDVENAINDYIRDDLGIKDITLDLQFGHLADYSTTANMQLASGEKMDIYLALPLNVAVANGYLLPLDEYLDKELSGAANIVYDWLSCGTIDGVTYAIPCYKGQVLSWKYIYDKDLVDGVYDMSQVKSVDDLDDALAALKAAYPEERFMVYNNQLPPLYGFQDHTNVVGTYFATVGDSTTLVNYFETDAFRKAVYKAYEWSQKGYSDPEGSNNTLLHDAIIMSGQSKGVIMGHAYSIETIEQMFTMNNSYGGNFGAVEIATSDMTNNPLVYGIAYTSENPSAAARMLNLIWTDEFIASTLIYGIEGVSWEWNEEKTSIQYPEGLGIDTVPYTALYTCGAFGNQFLLYGFDGNTSEADKVFMKKLIDEAWYPKLFGFTPDSSKVATQIAAISNVYDQYYDVLTYGDVNPDVYLPQFLEALDAAGIDQVMAEYQAQVDAWLAAQ
jgi:putative aldouronate transport system substrate-binding protein